MKLFVPLPDTLTLLEFYTAIILNMYYMTFILHVGKTIKKSKKSRLSSIDFKNNALDTVKLEV